MRVIFDSEELLEGDESPALEIPNVILVRQSHFHLRASNDSVSPELRLTLRDPNRDQPKVDRGQQVEVLVVYQLRAQSSSPVEA